MGKSLFLFGLSMLLGVANCSNVLMAADDVMPKSPVFTDPLTVEIVEKPVMRASQTTMASAPVYTASANPVPAVPVYPVYTVPANYIAIAGRTIEIVDVATTGENAGNHVNRYNGKFLYGHNSPGVFGPILGLGVGATFSVTSNGTTKNYMVASTEMFEKNPTTGQLQKDGAGSFMNVVANASYRGTYDLALMTCAGVSYGNGDASHRFVIFAKMI